MNPPQVGITVHCTIASGLCVLWTDFSPHFSLGIWQLLLTSITVPCFLLFGRPHFVFDALAHTLFLSLLLLLMVCRFLPPFRASPQWQRQQLVTTLEYYCVPLLGVWRAVGSGQGRHRRAAQQRGGTVDGLDAILCLLLPPLWGGSGCAPSIASVRAPSEAVLVPGTPPFYFSLWEELSSAFLVHYSQSAMPSFCLRENVRLVCIGLVLKSLENI